MSNEPQQLPKEKIKKARLEIVEGIGGPCVLLNGLRIAGPKPNGGAVFYSAQVPVENIEVALRDYAP